MTKELADDIVRPKVSGPIWIDLFEFIY